MNLELQNRLSLKSDRFVIHPLREEDVTPAYLSWFSDPQVLQHIISAPGINTLEQLRQYVREKQSCADALMLGIFLQKSDQHIGNIKFEPIRWDKGDAVVGILVGEPAWRAKGVFKEAFEACSKELARQASITNYWLGVHDDNLFALKAYQRAGFTLRTPPPDLFPKVRQGCVYMHLSKNSLPFHS